MKKLQFLSTQFAVCLIWFLFFEADGFGSTPSGPQLPPLSYTPADRLRGAQLTERPVWSDPTASQWKYIVDFPKWGHNVFRLFLGPFADGKPILPGQPLILRLAESLKRFTTVIDRALQQNIHFIICFNPSPPPPFHWPDDGRSLWKDASAQNELVQAWRDLAKHFKGRKGIIFELINEPAGITADEIAGTTLYQNRFRTLFTPA